MVGISCYLCPERFGDELDLAQHLVTDHSAYRYHCIACRFSAKVDADRVRHLTLHDQRPHKCGQCPERYETDEQLRQHEVDSHGLGDEKMKEVINIHKCYLCEGEPLLESRDVLRKHLETMHPFREYSCDQCDYSTFKVRVYNHHLSRHDAGIRPFKCSICPLRFYSSFNTVNHEISAHNLDKAGTRPKYGCKSCGEEFFQLLKLQKHEQTVHGENELTMTKEEVSALQKRKSIGIVSCTVCNKSFPNNSQLQQHEFLAHNITKDGFKGYECSICSMKFYYASRLRLHEQKAHASTSSSGSIYKCYLCNDEMIFEIKSQLYKHLVKEHTSEKYSCGQCGHTTRRVNGLNRHLLRHDASLRRFQCKLCNLRYANELTLRRHKCRNRKEQTSQSSPIEYTETKTETSGEQTSQSSPIEYTETKTETVLDQPTKSAIYPTNRKDRAKFIGCYLCSTVTQLPSKASLLQHLDTEHPDQQMYHCDECNLDIAVKVVFNRHLSRHDANIRPHKCSHCPVRFIESEHRKQHEFTIHGVENGKSKRKHPPRSCCEVCGKRIISQKLEQHMRAEHPYARPRESVRIKSARMRQRFKDKFRNNRKERAMQKRALLKCYFCRTNKRLKNRDSLKRHLRHVHPTQPSYRCTECDYSTKFKLDYNNHLSRHDSTVRPHKCRICPLRFFTTNSRIRHQATLHHAYAHLKIRSCSDCGKKYATKSKLLAHERAALHGTTAKLQKNSKQFACTFCNKLFFDNAKKLAHEADHRAKRGRCYLCSTHTLFDSQRKLQKHLKEKHPRQGVYQCEDCSYRTRGREDFNLHRSQHSTSSTKQSDSKKMPPLFVTTDKRRTFKCYLCRKDNSLESRADLLEHLQSSHAKQEMYQCEQCTFSVNIITIFNQHLAQHE